VRFVGLLLPFALLWAPARAAEPLPLKDGDRVVFVGSTVIEREQRYGYWETALTVREPQKNVTFRNLGWSGDTVWGESRCRFDFEKPGEGVRLIVEHVKALKPTVIVLGYGTNESFAGEAGLPRFRDGLNALLDALAPTKARVALLAPLPIEPVRGPLPYTAARVRNVSLYRDAIRGIATTRGAEFLDLLELLKESSVELQELERLTDNGMHPTNYGYWRTAPAWQAGVPAEEVQRPIVLDAIQRSGSITLTRLPGAPLRSEVGHPPVLLGPLAPRVRAHGLPAGMYTLQVGDRRAVNETSAAEWDKGVLLTMGPDYEQIEKLRQTIIEKNRLYFHRWRPQNETYLFGFRKYEQGQNAREIPQFDPLIEKREQEIARLRVPVAHTYELVPVTEKQK
jgi:lysophospholipase L1-like esterase